MKTDDNNIQTNCVNIIRQLMWKKTNDRQYSLVWMNVWQTMCQKILLLTNENIEDIIIIDKLVMKKDIIIIRDYYVCVSINDRK